MALISGIQQVGIGCADAAETFTWLRKAFGLDVKIFDDEAKAELMTRYTGGEVHDVCGMVFDPIKGNFKLSPHDLSMNYFITVNRGNNLRRH